MVAETCRKVLAAGESQPVGDFRDRQIPLAEQLPGPGEPLAHQVLRGRLARVSTEELADASVADTQFAAELLDAGEILVARLDMLEYPAESPGTVAWQRGGLPAPQ